MHATPYKVLAIVLAVAHHDINLQKWYILRSENIGWSPPHNSALPGLNPRMSYFLLNQDRWALPFLLMKLLWPYYRLFYLFYFALIGIR